MLPLREDHRQRLRDRHHLHPQRYPGADRKRPHPAGAQLHRIPKRAQAAHGQSLHLAEGPLGTFTRRSTPPSRNE